MYHFRFQRNLVSLDGPVSMALSGVGGASDDEVAASNASLVEVYLDTVDTIYLFHPNPIIISPSMLTNFHYHPLKYLKWLQFA